jgi:serpin B
MIFSLLTGCGISSNLANQNSSFDIEKINPTVVKGNTEFAFEIFKELNREDGNKNIFISPLSISTALSMTYQGAKNTTRDGMAKTLRYEEIDNNILNDSYRNLLRYLRQADDEVELSINNSIWIRKGENIKEDFLSINKDIFDAYIKELDFSENNASEEINNWISDATKGKIKKMITPPIPPQVVMYLINAIYFKGQWSEEFKKENTFQTKFYTSDGREKDIMMMNRKGSVEYTQGDNYKAVRLPYGKGKTSMYCILPNEGISVDRFIEDKLKDKWNEIRESIVPTEDVILQIPRFKVEYGIKNLKESLTQLGMGEAFSESADFSGIRKGIFISRVLHKAVIEVNEEGSEAAGVTVVEMKESAMLKPITFIANRPFIFIITDDETGTILFMGKLSKIN